MRISLKVIIYLMTASVRLLSVTGQTDDGDNTIVEKKCNSPAIIDSDECNGNDLSSCVMLIQEKDEGGHVIECKFYISDEYIKNLDPDDSGCSCESAQPETRHSVACVRLLSVTGQENDGNNKPVKINRHIGETVQMRFNYQDSHESNEKFLCWKKRSSCGKPKHESEDFCIKDDRIEKYVDMYIKNLVKDDSGSYWCGFNKLGHVYPKIRLSVARENKEPVHTTRQKTTTPTVETAEKLTETTETDSTHQQNTTSSATSKNRSGDPMKPGEIAAAVVCPALLLILVLVLILCRHKLPRTQVCCAAGGSSEQRTNAEHNTEGNQGDHHYEEIQMRNQQASSGDALPSVYATVNLPVDELHYAGIKFQEKSFIVSTDGNALPDANKNVSSACVNSSISSSQGDTHPPAAQQTLYSTVTIAKPGKA